jgi:hypothetical protein
MIVNIASPPPILIVVLKRYNFDRIMNVTSRDTTEVQYSLQLTLKGSLVGT